MSEIIEKPLYEIGCSFLSGFAFKSFDYSDIGIPLIKIGNIQNRNVTIDLNGDYVSKALINDKTRKFLLNKNDVLIAMTGQGSVGRVGKLKLRDDEKAFLNQRVGKFLCDEVGINKDYLYYILTTDKYQDYLFNTGAGSGQPNLSPELILQTEIPWVEYPEQIAIASILSSLDDKIDLLHRQNKTLEQMAETLFRQWFVVEAKEEWEEISIESLFEVRDGTHDSPKKQDFGKKLITSRHLKSNYIDFENAYTISEFDYNAVNKRSKVEQGDILFSMIGTIGNLYLEESENIDYAIKNIGLFKTSQNIKWCYFTYLWLKSDIGNQFIHENRSGSTQEYISLGNLRSIVFYVESKNQVEDFNWIVDAYFKKIKSNQTQIRTLITMRDTLLPKLMSGEVRVEM